MQLLKGINKPEVLGNIILSDIGLCSISAHFKEIYSRRRVKNQHGHAIPVTTAQIDAMQSEISESAQAR